MSERKIIYYTFDSPESWQNHNKKVTEIIQGDTNIDNWICNRALPPACHPPLTPDNSGNRKVEGT
ncbi:hypothetical protein BO94DRAFT_589275 [Aspergillus sclerotioniger CBS 115572]|uniref:Uncharacterized protein n=1 Tax=Aspergillus sclerotioniger CBS 115572 TaxID=1450535 RepID=A0A317VNE9_9EURO|nr:hypothetical protein BO94DRAFT_589275 [Aspergillus sclerotioniger CBS 115572]PWY74607.1 hypothetical protein BO94DRAFT_589275 [Aspergillus sclerotioniger CBS 115572]